MNTSAQVFEPVSGSATDQTDLTDETGAEHEPARSEVEVRRRGEVTGSIGVAGCLVALAWFARAAASGAALDWAVVVAMGAVGVLNLLAFVDARTPVLLADDQGVRVRRGRTWQGLTWSQVDRVEVCSRRGPLRDGSVDFTAVAGQDGLGVRLSLTTRVVGLDDTDLPSSLRLLAGSGVEVVEVEPTVRRRKTRGAGTDEETVGEVAETAVTPDLAFTGADDAASADQATSAPVAQPAAPAASAPAGRQPSAPLPLRDLSAGSRAEVMLGATALRLDPSEKDDQHDGPRLPEARELRRDGSVNLVEETTTWGERVQPIARAGDAVDPLVLDDHAPRPVVDPIVGPELAAARTRLGLSVDQLAERTRIRPHVIESIEVDDFAPCGGDFYARGHLRTLARVLGADAAPLLRTYDAHYADAPIDARRVFEAELATGAGGSIRGTRGGPNWSVLVAVVMTIILVWSVAQLVVDQPDVEPASPRLNSSGGVDNGSSATGAAVPVQLTAAGGGAQVIVRSGSQVVFDDQLAFMQTVQIDVAPPVRISSTDGGLRVNIDGQDEGSLGQPGEEAQDVFVP